MRQADKLSILIVDDHLLIRLGLKQILSHEFRDVVFGEAGTAKEALAQVAAQPWHLVILDISLPDDDGFSVLETPSSSARSETFFIGSTFAASRMRAARDVPMP